MDREELRRVNVEAIGDVRLAAALEPRLVEMRALLATMRSASTATALRALRDSFPDVPLGERVRALATTRG